VTAEALAWAIGIGLPVLTAAVVFLANWLRDVSKKVAETSREVERMRSHVAENYVRGHEVTEVKRAVEMLRQELTHKVDELLKAVHELIGQSK
jgi:uncharacterized protein YoxC